MVSRGATALQDPTARQHERRPLCGTLDDIGEDVERYREAGVTELFIDLNMDPRIGDVDTDPHRAVDIAFEVLERLAPQAA